MSDQEIAALASAMTPLSFAVSLLWQHALFQTAPSAFLVATFIYY